jgi:hypothetical protein
MDQMTRRAFNAAGFALLLATSTTFAQQQSPTVRVRGTVEGVDGPMLTVKSRDAAAAQPADRVDYWIRRHVLQYCYGTHPSQSQSKFNPSRDRRVGLSAIGQC